MIAKVEILFDVNDVHVVLVVQIFQVLQYVHLDHSLLLKSLLAANDLDGHVLLLLMVEAFEHLTEAALAKRLHYLVPIGDVIFGHLDVGAILVVVVFYAVRLQLLGLQTEKPHLGVLVYFGSLVLRQLFTVDL